MTTCCFTGHRTRAEDSDLKRIARGEIERLISLGVTEFLSGGVCGWDLLCAGVVADIKHTCREVKLRFILACPPYENSEKWEKNDQDELYRLMKSADSVEVLSDSFCKGSVRFRNRRLVEGADVCLCWFNEHKFTGNTLQTVHLAKKRGIEVINLYNR